MLVVINKQRTIYNKQKIWAVGSDIDKINDLIKQIGKGLNLTDEKMNECLKNSDVQDEILNQRIEAQKKYRVESTPTIIINEKNMCEYLYTKNIPDPDLLIRTGNTRRLSNFLLWQLAYSEIFFEKKLWPAFNEKDYNRIIKEYKKIKRNFGKI